MSEIKAYQVHTLDLMPQPNLEDKYVRAVLESDHEMLIGVRDGALTECHELIEKLQAHVDELENAVAPFLEMAHDAINHKHHFKKGKNPILYRVGDSCVTLKDCETLVDKLTNQSPTQSLAKHDAEVIRNIKLNAVTMTKASDDFVAGIEHATNHIKWQIKNMADNLERGE